MTRDEAREIVRVCLTYDGPTAEQAQAAFEAEFEEALAVLYPFDDAPADAFPWET